MAERIGIDGSIPLLPLPASERGGDRGFGHRLKEAVQEVNGHQQAADQAMDQVARGSMGIHEGMTAVSKADISLRLLLQVRNKVLEAYKEVMRMGF